MATRVHQTASMWLPPTLVCAAHVFSPSWPGLREATVGGNCRLHQGEGLAQDKPGRGEAAGKLVQWGDREP